MPASPSAFPSIELEQWRARVGSDPKIVAGDDGIEGITLPLLCDRAPAVPAVVPPRTPGWRTVMRLDDGVEVAEQIAELAVGDVDVLWLPARADGAPHGSAAVETIVALLPERVALHIDCARGAIELASGMALDRIEQLAFDPHAALAHGRLEHASIAIGEAVALRRAAPTVRTWCCDGTPWHDAGASAVLELAIVIAGALAAVRAAEHDGLAIAPLAAGLTLRLGLGGEPLLDIAKLRAARSLWHACASRLGIAAIAVPLEARSSRRLRAHLDVDTNLVRATLEGFAGALGGADAIILEHHDLHARGSDGSRRWARNVSHVLRGESHLDRIDDPTAGSYAIEHATAELARAAWDRIARIDRDGGLAAAIARGELQREAAATAARRRARIGDGSHPLVGVSKFPAPGQALATPQPVAQLDPSALASLDLCAPFEGVVR